MARRAFLALTCLSTLTGAQASSAQVDRLVVKTMPKGRRGLWRKNLAATPHRQRVEDNAFHLQRMIRLALAAR